MLAQAVRLQPSNLAARNCSTAGVQSTPKLLDMINYVERGNPVLRLLGRLTVRQAVGGLGCDALGSECLTKMVRIPVETLPAL